MENDNKPSSFKTTAANHSYADPFLNFLKEYEQIIPEDVNVGQDLALECRPIWDLMSPEEKQPYVESAQKIMELRVKAASALSQQAEIECIKKQDVTCTITSESILHGSSEGHGSSECSGDGPKLATRGFASVPSFEGVASLPEWQFIDFNKPSPCLRKYVNLVPCPDTDDPMDTSPPASGEEATPYREAANVESSHGIGMLCAQASWLRFQQAESERIKYQHSAGTVSDKSVPHGLNPACRGNGSKPATLDLPSALGLEGAAALPSWEFPTFGKSSRSSSKRPLFTSPDEDHRMETSPPASGEEGNNSEHQDFSWNFPPASGEEATPNTGEENNNSERQDFNWSFPPNEGQGQIPSMFPNWKSYIPAKPGMQLPPSLTEAWGRDGSAETSQEGRKRAWPRDESNPWGDLGSQGLEHVGPQTPGWTTGPSPVTRHDQPWYEAWTPDYAKRFKRSNHDGSSMDLGQGHVAPLVPYWSGTPASRGTIQQQDLNQGMSDNPSNQGLGHTQLLNHASTCESLFLGQGNVCPAAPPRSQGPTTLNNSEGESEQVPILSHPPWYSTFQ